jgi:transcriptional regulator with XRE-family HTH domain
VIAGYNLYGFNQTTLKLLYVQDVQKRIGDTVRALRLKRGWSQDVFADKSGLNRAHVGEVERGESNVTIQTLKTIAETLGVKITDLVKGL